MAHSDDDNDDNELTIEVQSDRALTKEELVAELRRFTDRLERAHDDLDWEVGPDEPETDEFPQLGTEGKRDRTSH